MHVCPETMLSSVYSGEIISTQSSSSTTSSTPLSGLISYADCLRRWNIDNSMAFWGNHRHHCFYCSLAQNRRRQSLTMRNTPEIVWRWLVSLTDPFGTDEWSRIREDVAGILNSEWHGMMMMGLFALSYLWHWFNLSMADNTVGMETHKHTDSQR